MTLRMSYQTRAIMLAHRLLQVRDAHAPLSRRSQRAQRILSRLAQRIAEVA